MPRYELLCLARPLLAREEMQRIIHKVGSLVQAKGGVVTGVQSFGEQPLAYKIRGVRGKFDKAHIWQLDFAAAPPALAELNMQLRVTEDVLRWVVVKRPAPRLPAPRELYHRLSEHAHLLRPPPRPGQAPPPPPPFDEAAAA